MDVDLSVPLPLFLVSLEILACLLVAVGQESAHIAWWRICKSPHLLVCRRCHEGHDTLVQVVRRVRTIFFIILLLFSRSVIAFIIV